MHFHPNNENDVQVHLETMRKNLMFLLAFVANPKRMPYSINCELYLVRILLTYFRLLNYIQEDYISLQK